MNESSLIEKVKKILDSKIIGDDTAPMKIGNKTLLFTNDILLEGQHFLDHFPTVHLGWKAVSVNVSDIVASGGQPKYLLVSLLLPKNKTDLVDSIYRGIAKACRYYGCQVIGGNMTASDKLGIDIFMVGEAKKFVARRGAHPKDNLYLSGPVGDSKAGLELLLMKRTVYEPFEKKLIERHLRPVVDLKLKNLIGRYATAAIDLSDGLSSDAGHLSKNSRVKLVLNAKQIPISDELKQFCIKYRHDPVGFAVGGGEDYRILFTTKNRLPKTAAGLYLIGSLKQGSGLYLDKIKLANKSFDHFSSS